MKKLILMAFLAFASASSFAQGCIPGPQIMGQPQRCYDGRIITPNYVSGYNPNMYGQPMMPIQGNPGWFQQGNNILRCSTASRVVGGVIGGLIGHYAGREITTHGHNLGGLGAVVGAGLGQQISCEMMATVSPVQERPRPQLRQQVDYDPSLSADMQTGGYIQRPRITRVPSDCDIDGKPELQDLKGLTEAQCTAVAKLAATRGVVQGDTIVAQAPSAPVAQTTTPSSGVCRVKISEEKTYRFNAVDGVKFGKAECMQYLNKSIPLPAESSMSILP